MKEEGSQKSGYEPGGREFIDILPAAPEFPSVRYRVLTAESPWGRHIFQIVVRIGRFCTEQSTTPTSTRDRRSEGG